MPARAARVTHSCRPHSFLDCIPLLILILALGLASPRVATAQDSLAVAPVVVAPPAPAGNVKAMDVPNDRGDALEVTWSPSPQETAGEGIVTAYLLERAPAATGPWTRVDSVGAGTHKKTDTVTSDTAYVYRVTALGAGGAATPSVSEPAGARAQWFNTNRVSVLLAMLLFFGLVILFTIRAQNGEKLFIRRIAGIDAIEEAIGRATEMGRSVLYVPGINDIDDIQTMASLNILESVAKVTAKYETPIIVPCNYPVVMTLAQEMVKNGYVAAGRADGYDPNSVRYVTTEQFAYVAAITGIMLRDKPAANIYLGSFYAESLLLAETGFSTGAIQIAGTAQVAQLPFFVVACDYTLIGEELYAAGAYLTREPRLLGSLKGSDYMKVALIAAIVVGCVLETIGMTSFKQFFASQ